jgi:hypothetical protein
MVRRVPLRRSASGGAARRQRAHRKRRRKESALRPGGRLVLRPRFAGTWCI